MWNGTYINVYDHPIVGVIKMLVWLAVMQFFL